MPRKLKQKQKQKQHQSVTVNINQGRKLNRRRRTQQKTVLQNPQVRHVFNEYASLFHTVVDPKPLQPSQDISVSEQKAVPAPPPPDTAERGKERDKAHRSSHRSRQRHPSPEPSSRREAIAQLREGLLGGLRSAGAAVTVNPERVAPPIIMKSELPLSMSGPPDLSQDHRPRPHGQLPRRRDLNSPGIPERVEQALDELRGMSSNERQHQLRGERLRNTAKRLYIRGYTSMNSDRQRAAINDLLGPSYL